jgi:hypothetical protein
MSIYIKHGMEMTNIIYNLAVQLHNGKIQQKLNFLRIISLLFWQPNQT